MYLKFTIFVKTVLELFVALHKGTALMCIDVLHNYHTLCGVFFFFNNAGEKNISLE